MSEAHPTNTPEVTAAVEKTYLRLKAENKAFLDALDHCQRVLAAVTSGDPSRSIQNLYVQAREAEKKARAAIAKAKGEA